MSVVTTLNYTGRTEEAVTYYCDVLDAKLVFLMRFCDSPDQTHSQPGMEDLIFHATFQIDGTVFMASDIGYVDAESAPSFSGFALALQLQSTDRAKRVFAALADGGQILIPLAKSAFTSWYGIVIDRFGVSWKINVDQDA